MIGPYDYNIEESMALLYHAYDFAAAAAIHPNAKVNIKCGNAERIQ